jgi:hypothetical protein
MLGFPLVLVLIHLSIKARSQQRADKLLEATSGANVPQQ